MVNPNAASNAITKIRVTVCRRGRIRRPGWGAPGAAEALQPEAVVAEAPKGSTGLACSSPGSVDRSINLSAADMQEPSIVSGHPKAVN
ncbi:hypothetical protein Areg01_85470 [Actinoplanes regularis]|nr:hypothetical protein Areg01_85470 [Actinoplanes regularis]